MNTQNIKDLLNIQTIADELITTATIEAQNFLTRKGLAAGDTEPIFTAWKYLTAYFLLPKLTLSFGELGVSRRVGYGDSAQELLSQYDLERLQTYYYNLAMTIINDTNAANFPFGIDI